MTRDQKPGRFKLVGGSTPNPGRRRDDRFAPSPALASSVDDPGETADAITSPPRVLLLASLFLLACAAGGACTVMLGLVEGLVQ